MILCRDCYIAERGGVWFPATMGRSVCDECGHDDQECYKVEEDDEQQNDND